MLIHPVLIHYPIAFYFLELFLLTLWFFKKQDSYRNFAKLAFLLAYFFTWLAIASGLFDAGGLKPTLRFPGVRRHFFAAVAVAGWYSLRFVTWRLAPSGQIKIHLLQSLAGNLLIALTGYWGGKLVYD